MTSLAGLLLTVLAALGAGCDSRQDADPVAEAEPIDWDALMPADWQPEDYLETLAAEGIDALGDAEPRAIELMDQLLGAWAKAPVVAELDGRRVRLPGFVVPLEWAAEEMASFLLVPYFGACIHVPPPPANQTVYVVMPPDRPYRGGLYETLWVTGTLRVLYSESALAIAGYRLDAEGVAPYAVELETP